MPVKAGMLRVPGPPISIPRGPSGAQPPGRGAPRGGTRGARCGLQPGPWRTSTAAQPGSAAFDFSGFCNGSSHGYLIYIKNKYSKNFNKKIPKIINNFNGKKEYWVFNDVNAQINENQIILLNGNDIDLKEYKIIDEYKNNCFFIEKK